MCILCELYVHFLQRRTDIDGLGRVCVSFRASGSEQESLGALWSILCLIGF